MCMLLMFARESSAVRMLVMQHAVRMRMVIMQKHYLAIQTRVGEVLQQNGDDLVAPRLHFGAHRATHVAHYTHSGEAHLIRAKK